MKYKRKFLVQGDTIPTCWDYRHKCEKVFRAWENRPCVLAKTINGRPWVYKADESRCPFPINKPTEYIVSETEDGEWQCSCKAWTTHKPRIDCKHIVKAKADPKKYEVAVDWIGKTIETMKRVTR